MTTAEFALTRGSTDEELCVLRGGGTGERPYFSVSANETWVAVPDTAGGGAGWFRCDADRDPAASGWDVVDPAAVLDRARPGDDRAAQLTAMMVSNCLLDGYGLQALELADALIDHGYTIAVSVSQAGDLRRSPGCSGRTMEPLQADDMRAETG